MRLEESTVRLQLDDQALAPTVFFARLIPNRVMQFCFTRGRNESSDPPKLVVSHTHLDLWVGTNVFHPLRSLVFGDHVESTAELGKPDLDLARQAAGTALRRQIKKLQSFGHRSTTNSSLRRPPPANFTESGFRVKRFLLASVSTCCLPET